MESPTITTMTDSPSNEQDSDPFTITDPRPPIIYKDRNPPITEIQDRLYLGDCRAAGDTRILREHKITAVCSLDQAPWNRWSQPWYKKVIAQGNHLFIYCEDSSTMDLLPEFARICDFINEHVKSGAVLVSCARGRSRSVAAPAAYLMRDCQHDRTSALALIGAQRKIKPNENFKEQLDVWEAVEGEIWTALGVQRAPYLKFLVRRATRPREAGLTGNETIGIKWL